MTEFINGINSFFEIILQFGMIFVLAGIFYVIYIVATTVASNRAANWGLFLFLGVTLIAMLLMIKYYPAMVMESIADGLERAHPEADNVRTQLRGWVQVDASQPAVILSTSTPYAPEATAVIMAADEQGGFVPELTATPRATSTPRPLPTKTAIPSPTAVPTIDNAKWNPATPPPTPEI